jgi:hypothetical protein
MMTQTTQLSQEQRGDRHFLPPEDPSNYKRVQSFHNLEYVMRIHTWGQHNVIRQGFAGKTTETFRYGINGTIMLKPLDKEKERVGLDHENFSVYVQYVLGEQQGAGVRAGNEVTARFNFEKKRLEELCVNSFPEMGMVGRIVIATIGRLPGDTEKQVFFDMFEDAVLRNKDFQRYAKAHHAFLDAYQMEGEQA